MKFRMIATALMFFFLVMIPCMAGAAWESVIMAEGEDLGVPYKSSVTIGVQSEAETRPSPPSPPAYSCSIRIAPADWSDYLATDIRKEGERTYCWILAVNPHGNAGTPIPRTTAVSWNPADFGEGEYVLRQGYECSGTVLIADMKQVNSYNVSGEDSEQYFSLTFTMPENNNNTNNIPQEPDWDHDGIPDITDNDDDNDGVPDEEDAFPLNAGEQKDTDNDGTGDSADTDDDNDGISDDQDAFPLNPAEQKDTDKDGTGDSADNDDDNDGVPDESDAFPLNPADQKDTDNDGTGDSTDTDDDNDGIPDDQDAFPLNPAEQKDTDNDGTGDNTDTDDDNDEMPDEWEIQYGFNPLVKDADGDADADGIINLDEYKQGSNPLSASVISPDPEQNSPPAQPNLLLPADNETGVSLTPVLQAGPFSDPDSGDSHKESRWQISETADFSEILLDITAPEYLTEWQIQEDELEENTVYYWRVMFFDNMGGYSEWSIPFHFSTAVQDSGETEPSGEESESPDTDSPEEPVEEPSDNPDADTGENTVSDSGGGGGGGCFISALPFF